MAIREGHWDCQYCGTIGNLGRHKACTNCGRSRPDGTKFYLADEAEIVDKRLESQAQLGPDWICEFCGTSNAANITICGSCGAPREGSSPVQQVKEYAPGEAPTTGDMTFEEEPNEGKGERVEPAASKSSSKIVIFAIAGAILLLCLGLDAFLIFAGKDADATVSGFEWQRTQAVEAFQTVTEEDWNVPADGRILSQSQEIHHYDQVIDHYETLERVVDEQVQVGVETYVCGQRDLGNGFFEDIECEQPVYETQSHTESYEEAIYRDDPIFQTLYFYEIDKWIVIRNEENGASDHSPFWPRADLSDDEREGERSEYYVVNFADKDGESHSWEATLSEWQSFEQGQQVKLKFNAFGEFTGVEAP